MSFFYSLDVSSVDVPLTPRLLQVLQYGRKQSKLDGETEVLTLNLRSVGSVGHRIPQTLKVSVLLDERTDPDSFNFFVRNEDDALLGLGSRDEKFVTISGSGSGNADPNPNLTNALRDHLEDEGFVNEHQEVDIEKLRKEIRRLQEMQRERDKYGNRNFARFDDGLAETLCFKTVASWLGVRVTLGLTISNFRKLTTEDYLDLKNYEGCLKTIEGFCPTCDHLLWFIETLTLESVGVLRTLFNKRNHHQCNSNNRNNNELCPPKIQSALDYWNRQRRNYAPDCNLMLSKTSDPWRLSGICSHPQGPSCAVEFEATPTSDFMHREENSNKEEGNSYHSYEGYQQNYFSTTNVFPTSFKILRKLKVYVGFGVTILIVFLFFERKFRANIEEKRK